MPWVDQLSEMERFQLDMDLETKKYLKSQIDRMTNQLATMSHQDAWASQAMYLFQIPGFGVITVLTVLAAWHQESTRAEPSSALNPSPMPKAGRKELRWAMVEVAWRAVRADPVWKKRFEELKRRKHPNDAITVIAHQLMIVVWHILTRQQPYRHYTHERIAYKFLTWSWQLDGHQRRNLTRPQFVRYYLLRLGIGYDLKRIALNPKHPHRLASSAEVTTLFPELAV